MKDTGITYGKSDPLCPDCDALMVLRQPEPWEGWEPFWGCSRYPGCRATRSMYAVERGEDGWDTNDRERRRADKKEHITK